MTAFHSYAFLIFSLCLGASMAFCPQPSPRYGVERTQHELKLNMIGRLFGRSRNRKRVRTLEKETEPPATKKEEKPRKPPLFRVMLQGTEWQPEIVAKLLPRAIPQLDRMAAYELAVSARYNGKVALIITRQKHAETHCLALQRLGLPATMEPHDVER